MEGDPTGSADSALADLVRRACAGEALALEKALMAASPRLLARIERRLPMDVRSSCGADDLLQETFTDAFRAFAGFALPGDRDGGQAFFAWLSTIAEHRIVDAVRAYRALKRGGAGADSSIGAGGGGRAMSPGNGSAGWDQTTIVPLIEVLAVQTWTPSRSVAGKEIEQAVHAAIDGLYPAYREALELRYLLGLTPGEMARRLGRTEEAVHKLCNRALAALREALGGPPGESRAEPVEE